jgi:D-alanine-D-alanine ligase
MGEWYDEYFNRGYLRRWRLGLPNQEVESQVQWLFSRLGAAPGERVVDVGCGQGRYSLAMAKYNLRVVALDRSQVLLNEGIGLASQMHVKLNWIRSDMRGIPISRAAKAAILIDAFGFFRSPRDDLRALEEVAGALDPDGRFCIAIANGSRIKEAFRSRDRDDRGEVIVDTSRDLQDNGSVLHEVVSLSDAQGQASFERYQRLYSAEELTQLMTTAGFAVAGIYGSLEGGLFDAATSRKIVLVASPREFAG